MIEFEVTEEDADSGTACHSQDCALAKALQRMFPGRVVLVSNLCAKIDGIEYHLDKRAQDFINEYDSWNGKIYQKNYPVQVAIRLAA